MLDFVGLVFALVAAMFLRFDGAPPWVMVKMALFAAPYVALMKYTWMLVFGIPQFAWRYVGLREAMRIVMALLCATATLIVVRLVAHPLVAFHPVFRYAIIPFGVIAIDGLLSVVVLVSLRALRRAYVERQERAGRSVAPVVTTRTLIVGAGNEGVALAREIDLHPEFGIEPVGFVDDDVTKHGTRIHGIRVLGGTRELAALCRHHDVEQAILALPDGPGESVRGLLAAFDGVGIPVKIVPSFAAHVAPGTTGNLASSVRPIELEDLLRRSAVTLEDEPVDAFVRNRVVLVTGAGGSIGSEICRQVAAHSPTTLILIERSEPALYEIHRELSASTCPVIPLLVDVTDRARIDAVFREHRPNVVFHAAAHKHVPMLEMNVSEAVLNNLGGTTNVARAATAVAADAFVLISTDKAVNPSSVMGATKRAAELMVQSMVGESSTRLVAVRFGNVLGSSGSVIPLFREQISRGGPVTVTHPDMRRYFMTIPEACRLVLNAGALGAGGEVFILDMGEPVRITDLAEDLIRLSGFVPHRDIQIEYTGIRPGEKLFEELSVDQEKADRTRHPKIFVAKTRSVASDEGRAEIVALVEVAGSFDEEQTLAALAALVPEFGSRSASARDGDTA